MDETDLTKIDIASMIYFPNAKINLGLNVIERRQDGFHNIETVMIPIMGLCDILEITKSNSSGLLLKTTGIEMECEPKGNLVSKAYDLMEERYGVGGVKIHLHKIIPTQSGLGGGSADASFTIKGINQLFELGLDSCTMEQLAAEIGSDTAFFIKNRAQVATGRGEILTPTSVAEQLIGKRVVIVKPSAVVSTAEAYGGITPVKPTTPLTERLSKDISEWKDLVVNDFESHIIAAHPEIGIIKERLYELGALYASMSGAGSAIYGIFEIPEDGAHHFNTPLYTPLTDKLTEELESTLPNYLYTNTL